MFTGLKRSWRSFADAEPGQRFRRRYDARRRREPNRLGGVLTTLLGLFFIFIGAVLLVIPGPGIPFVAVGVALMAQQVLWLARVADWTELKARHLLRGARRLWKGAPVGLRVVAATVAALIGTAAGYGAYKVVF